MKQLFLSLLILISFPLITKAQVIRDNNSNVRVFDNQTQAKSTVVTSYNALKLGLCHLINGRYVLFYERKFSDVVSFETGVGFTYGDYYTLLSAGNGDFSGSTFKFGPTVEGTLKFFPGKDAMFGTYFGINARYAGYNMTDISSGLDLRENQTQAMITVGHQDYDWADVFVIDYYVSIGVIGQTRESLATDSNNNPIVASTASTTPCIRLGLKFGFDW
jgi:hypothetical protein